MAPSVSVVISTYNRAESLARTIQTIEPQLKPQNSELIVVDNRCTDNTRDVVLSLAAANPRIRYLFEEQQGVSYGRNAGIKAAQSGLIAFTDDDVAVTGNWLSAIQAAAEANSTCGCLGGKVLGHWPRTPPEWLTSQHWGPLALLDYGPAQTIGAHNRKCLITANMAVRREAFDRIGYFRPAFQKTVHSTCSIEDRELQERYWNAGGRCWFDPNIVVYAEIQDFRLDKAYHRQWHYSHGELSALLRDAEFEKSSIHLFGIPGHVLRRFAEYSLAAAVCHLTGRPDKAFEHETQARFFAGFIHNRLKTKR